MGITSILAGLIFLLIFTLIVTEKFNKTVLAVTGAAIFVVLKFLDSGQAFHHIDWEVIFILVSMMIMVSITQRTGIFQWAAIKLAKSVNANPVSIMIGMFVLTALFSAFLDNVTTVLILVPITILIALELGLDPVPFILLQAIGSNIGGTATLIGDPPNILIGLAANLSFLDFLVNLAPLILLLLTLVGVVIFAVFSKRLRVTNERKARIMDMDENKAIEDLGFAVRSLVILGLVIVGFLLHTWIEIPLFAIAMAGAGVMLLFESHDNVHHVLKSVEWETIFFFVGLFIMVGGLVELGVIKLLSEKILEVTRGNLILTGNLILWFSGLLSGVVDNIPYVATMIPLVKGIQATLSDPAAADPLWWALSLGACLGGNLTLVGASANVVSAGIAARNGHPISFVRFTKYGLGVGVLTLLISNIWLMVFYFR